MPGFHSSLGLFLTWWGAFLLAALDSSLLFFLPFGIDGVVIYLAARDRDVWWAIPLLATAGSLAGCAVSFWIGRKIGEAGLERLIPARRLDRIRNRVRETGAIAMAVPALLPPPFPLTPFILTCGALSVDPLRFFSTFATVRLVRFGVEAIAARLYGRGILRILESDTFQTVIVAFIVIAVLGTLISAVTLWRSTRAQTA